MDGGRGQVDNRKNCVEISWGLTLNSIGLAYRRSELITKHLWK